MSKPKCLIDTCDRVSFSRGLCRSCYRKIETNEEIAAQALPTYQPKNLPPEKLCPKCNIVKPAEAYGAIVKRLTRSGEATYLRSYCIDCSRKHRRDTNKITRYEEKGWSTEMFELCFELQDGKCENDGCTNPAEVPDHDHHTLEPRAILCQGCNKSLGFLREDPERIRGLARYAERCQDAKREAM